MRKVRIPRSGWARILVVACVAAEVAGITGVAFATIPDSGGVIHGCYSANGANGTNGTQLNIVNSDVASCSKGQNAITWNEQGPKGDPGPAGTNGTNGNTILNGSGTPSDSLGGDGDFYLDTSAEVLYGPKSGGSWPTSGTSLIGPQGTQGPAGPTSLDALNGSPCTFDGQPSTTTVAVDNTTGAVSITCTPVPVYKVSVTASGLAEPLLNIQDDTNPANDPPCSAGTTSCSTLVEPGDKVNVTIQSGTPGTSGTPFTYDCPGETPRTATPSDGGNGAIYVGQCPSTGDATITADYAVTASGL